MAVLLDSEVCVVTRMVTPDALLEYAGTTEGELTLPQLLSDAW